MKKLIFILALSLLFFAFFSCADGDEIDTETETFVKTETVTDSESVTEIETDEVTLDTTETETVTENETDAVFEEPISEISVPEGYNLLWVFDYTTEPDNSKTDYSYDEKGRLTSIHFYNEENTLYEEVTFTYENDELISVFYDSADDAAYTFENSRLSVYREYISELFESDTLADYKYDEKGQIVRI